MTIQELEQCIALYGKDIYSFCVHITMDKDTADDLYQDTFLEAMKKLNDIKYKENPKSYLISIALRLWKNKVRKIAWRNRIAPTCSEETLMDNIVNVEDDFAGDVVSKEEKKMLWSAIHNLSDQLRIPILLFYMENMSLADIAKLLTVPQGTVKSRLYNARKQLERELEDYFNE